MATATKKPTSRGPIPLSHAEVLRSLKGAQRTIEQMQKRYSDAVPAGDRKKAFPDLTEAVSYYGANKEMFSNKPQTRESASRTSAGRAPRKRSA